MKRQLCLKAQQTTVPLTMQDPADLPTLELSLQEAVNLADDCRVLCPTYGGGVSRCACWLFKAVATVYDPATHRFVAATWLGSSVVSV